MKEDKEIGKNLKEYLDKKQYKEAVVLLRREIINLVVKDVQKKDEEYKFSTILDLVDKTEKMLYKYRNVIKYLYNPDEYYDIDEVSELMEIYNKIKNNK